MIPQGLEGRRPGVQECEGIALFDHLFEPVGRGVEFRREQVIDDGASACARSNAATVVSVDSIARVPPSNR